MTSPGTDTTLPGVADLRRACAEFGVDARDARLLHARSNAVYLLPHENLVARLSPPTSLRQSRANTVIAVTRWLADQAGSVALAPAPGAQPVVLDTVVATFWPFRPPPKDPSIADLAGLLRSLHALPAPPFPVQRYQPLTRLRDAIVTDAQRTAPVLSSDDSTWLAGKADELTSRFDEMDFPLGIGLVHADAHTENVAFDDGWRLIDFDEVCLGPRELDLVGALPDHFHAPQAERERFLTAYGYDLTGWPGWTVLRDITELHSLSSYLRLAPGKAAAADQLRIRIRSLREDDRAVRWHAVS